MSSNTIHFPDLSKKVAHISINTHWWIIHWLTENEFDIVYILED